MVQRLKSFLNANIVFLLFCRVSPCCLCQSHGNIDQVRSLRLPYSQRRSLGHIQWWQGGPVRKSPKRSRIPLRLSQDLITSSWQVPPLSGSHAPLAADDSSLVSHVMAVGWLRAIWSQAHGLTRRRRRDCMLCFSITCVSVIIALSVENFVVSC